MQKISMPFLLNGAKNVRELGGYRTKDGAVTKHHSLLRGDSLHNLSEADCRFLYDYGVRCIIDLRSPDESFRNPDRLQDLYQDITYIQVPIQDYIRGNRYSEEFPPSMWQLYCWFLDDGRVHFYKIFEAIMKHPDSCVLFHCSGGKDRTGTLAMLLLKLAGVDDQTIIDDYAVTEEFMKDIFPKQVAELESRGLVVPFYIMESPPENMQITLQHLYNVYDNIENYFTYIGFTKEQISQLKYKLVNLIN